MASFTFRIQATLQLDVCMLRELWPTTLTQPGVPPEVCNRFLQKLNLWRQFDTSPEIMLLALQTCTAKSALHMKYRHRFLTYFTSTFPTVPLPHHVLVDCIQAVETGPVIKEVFPVLCDIGRAQPARSIVCRVQNMLQRLAAVLTTNNLCQLAKLFSEPTPIWFNFQSTLLADGCISLQPCVLHFIQYLQEHEMMGEPLPAFLQQHRCSLYLQPAAAFQLVSLVYAERHNPKCAQMFLPLTVALTGYLIYFVCKRFGDFKYDKELCKFADLWTLWRHLLPQPVAAAFTNAYWSNFAFDNSYFEAAAVFCNHSEDAVYWARWLVWRNYTQRQVSINMLDTIIRQVNWPAATGELAGACRAIITANMDNTDDVLYTVAKEWRLVGCCLTTADGGKFLDEILRRVRMAISNDINLRTLETALELVRDGVIVAEARHVAAVEGMYSSIPEIKTILYGFLTLNLSPSVAVIPCILPIANGDQLLRLRQIVCLSRQRSDIVHTHKRKLFRECMPLLEAAMERPQFNLDDERMHAYTLALMLQPRTAVATLGFGRLLQLARNRQWLSPAVCEVGLRLVCTDTSFRVYFTRCVLSLLQLRNSTVVPFLKHWSLLHTDVVRLFTANLLPEQVDSLFLYAVALVPALEHSAAFVALAIHTGNVSVPFARAVATFQPVLIPDIELAYPAAADFLRRECGICMERMLVHPETEGRMLYCHPGFHNTCLRQWWETSGVTMGTCPLCKSIPPAFSRPLTFLPMAPAVLPVTPTIIPGCRFYASTLP